MTKSVYIHIPFCKKICYYCDFCKFYYNKEWIDKYLNSLEKEIKETYKKEEIYTLYIGGGTPSCLEYDELNKLLELTNLFNKKKLKEFTIEFNVEDISEEKLKLLKEYNVNRISIGVQSFNKKILKNIGREYNVNIIDKINLVKKYFDNISIDLMYAFFDETIDDVNKDLNEFLKLKIPHISCYSLIIEPHTRFFDKKPIDEELDYEMYKNINKTLKDNNYKHYEISNYSLSGYESKHNLVYWNNKEYYGFGVSASSYIDNKRITNTKNIKYYLDGINNKEIEIISNEDKMKYEVILGFRKVNGLSKKDFYKKYKKDIYDVFDFDKLIDNKYLIDDGENIYINEEYIYISNEILLNFI